MIEMKFNNRDAIPKVAVIKTRRADAPAIARWYSAFYAGDKYTLHIDGQKVALDNNGEMKV